MSAITFANSMAPRPLGVDDAHSCGQDNEVDQAKSLNFDSMFIASTPEPKPEVADTAADEHATVEDQAVDQATAGEAAVDAIIALALLSAVDGGVQAELPAKGTATGGLAANLSAGLTASGGALNSNRFRQGELHPADVTSGEVPTFSAGELANRVQALLVGQRSDKTTLQELTASKTDSGPKSQIQALATAASSSDEADQDAMPREGRPDLSTTSLVNSGQDVPFSLAPGGHAPLRSLPPTGSPAPSLSRDPAAEIASELGQGDAWLDGLSQDIARMTSEQSSLKFRVAPRTLGEIDVEVQNSADKTSVYFTSANPMAVTALQEAQPRLVADARYVGLADLHAHFGTKHGQSDSGRSRSHPRERDQEVSEIRSNSDQKNPAIQSHLGRINDRFA